MSQPHPMADGIVQSLVDAELVHRDDYDDALGVARARAAFLEVNAAKTDPAPPPVAATDEDPVLERRTWPSPGMEAVR